jgi:uncharacterized membrane protein
MDSFVFEALSAFAALGVLCALGVAAVLSIAFGRIAELRDRLGRLESATYAALDGVAPARSESAVDFERETWHAPAAVAADEPAPRVGSAATERAERSAMLEESARRAAAAEAARPRADFPKMPAFDWEVFAGGRLLNIIGGLVLVIGVGLALKYAFDQNWINQSMRIAGGVALGAGLLVLADVMRKRASNRWFTQGITGTGLGVLYVSGYAAFGSYHLWPFALAYGFMSLVTVAAFFLALRHDSLAVALIGWAGGFVTPFVMNDGSSNEIGLASYIVLLDIGLVAMALAKERWFALAPLALAGSSTTALAWYSQHADPSQWFVSTIALLSIWGVFFAADVYRTVRTPERTGLTDILGIANTFVLWSCLAGVLEQQRSVLEVVLLAVAAAFGCAYALLIRRAPEARWQRVRWYVTAAALVAGVTALRYNQMSLATVFVVEGVVLAALERLVRSAQSRARALETSIASSALVAAGACTLLVSDGALLHTGGVWSFAFGSRDLAMLAFVLGACALDRLLRGFDAWPQSASIVTRQVAMLAGLALTAVHADGYQLVVAYALEGLALIAIGTRAVLQDLEIDGVVVAAGALLVAVVQPDTWQYQHIFNFVPFANARFAGFAVTALALVAGGELLRRGSLLPGGVARALRAAGALSAVAAATLEVRDFFERALASARLEPQTAEVLARLSHLAGAEQLAFSGVWIAASLVLVGLGIALKIRDLRVMAIGLFDLTILKAFFVDLGSMETLYRIAAFIGLGLVLLAVSYIYQRLERGMLAPGGPAGGDGPGEGGPAGNRPGGPPSAADGGSGTPRQTNGPGPGSGAGPGIGGVAPA